MDGQRQGGQAMLPAGLDSDWINSWTESLSMVPLTLAVKMDENEEKTVTFMDHPDFRHSLVLHERGLLFFALFFWFPVK